VRTVLDRFREKYTVDSSSGCWIWTGSTNGAGYGELRVNNKKVYAHRWSMENVKGVPIPDGMVIDHLCRNPSCVNPAHLEIVTQSTNTQRGVGIGRPAATTCKNGHPYDAENTYVRPDGRGKNCVQCVRDRSRAYQQRRRSTS